MAVMLVETARRRPQQPAVICGHVRMTYAELDAAVNRLANALVGLGLRPGNKVLLMLPNLPEFVICYYGILKAGGVVVPVNVLYKAGELEFLLADSESAVCLAWSEVLPEALEACRRVPGCRHLVAVAGCKAAPAGDKPVHSYDELVRAAAADFDMVQPSADDTAAIVYTSGTTGKPKGAELTHFSQFFQCRVLPELTPDMWHDDDVTLIALPLFHCFGQTCLMSTAVAMGTTMSLLPRYEAGACLGVLERDGVTIFAGVPTMYVQMLHHPDRARYDLSRLRRCISGGAPIAVETLEAWKRTYGFDIREGYGLTETSPIATFSLGDIQPRYGSCGKPIWGCDVKVVDEQGRTLPPGKEGEVLIRGVNIMKGYYKNPQATAAAIKDRWLYAGDIGKLDEDGYLYIVGRVKDMIIRGGLKVYPREIEELLYEHPAIQECAVVGVPHPELGEEVKAVLFLKDGAAVSADEIRAYCKERVAPFKYPRLVEVRREPLPKGPTGKILKRALVQPV
jgi:long-chain acyl-CoA synthetase